MLKNYFTTAWRNLRRNKTFSFINIFGLSIGISASLVIFLLVQYDFSFDKFELDGDRIYRVVADSKNKGEIYHSNALPEPMAAAIKKEIPGIEIVAPFHTTDETRVTIPYPNPNNPVILRKQEDLATVDASYFNMLGYTWLAGTPATALAQPYQIVLTENKAHLYFGSTKYTDIIGKTITLDDTVVTTVSGIVKDLPGNTDFYFGAFLSMPTYYSSRMKNESVGHWDWVISSDQVFVKLAPHTTVASIDPQLTKILLRNSKPDPRDHSTTAVRLQPLSDIHFNLDYGVFDQSRQAHKPTLYGLLVVAAFLLLLACINFINLTTAQSSQRAKEIGIRKTMGSLRRQLVFQFLSETFVLTLLATFLSLALTPLLLQVFSDFIPKDFHFNLFRQPAVLLFLVILALVVTVLSGFYPALVLSGFKPVLVLKNQTYSSTGKTRSAWLRKSLTVSQFVVAQVFIIGTVLVSRQISYALNKDLGFKKDAIVYFRINNQSEARAKKALLLDKLKAIPGIALISNASNPPSSNGMWSNRLTFNDGKKEIIEDVQIKLADSNYFRMFGFHLLAGTSPMQSDTTNAIVINETYLHILGYQDPQKIIGKQVSKYNGNPRIVGVVQDFHQRSLRESIKPLAIANGVTTANVFNIALQPRNADGSNWTATLAAIEKAYRSTYPNDDYEYEFVDETIAKFYTVEKNISRLLLWATGLTIVISCLGLLGLVIYITNQRTKEIGIRKIVGASVSQIIVLLSSDFLKLVVVAFAIAVPLAWWGAHLWLDNFAYKTTLSWWLFLAGGLLMCAMALVILLVWTFRAAVANPADSLRTE
jgi:putative ABC transport system permease protein